MHLRIYVLAYLLVTGERKLKLRSWQCIIYLTVVQHICVSIPNNDMIEYFEIHVYPEQQTT